MTPVVVIRRTKTRGYQAIYRCASGREIVIGRGLDYPDALRVAAARAKAQGVHLEAAP